MSLLTYAALLLITCLLLPLVSPFPDADKITSLPDQPPVNFQQFGGYISVGQPQNQQRNLFYYFVQAETNHDSKPLVIWFNGGPGCSSVGAGAFSEHGPFMPNGNVLVKNNYSWNKEANMLYMESPAGVGFSYSVNKSYYDSVDDEMTARDNLEFLQNWLIKFPEYKNRDLFITGESYAGHYVPQFANLILNSTLKSNLKGIAIGNPLLEFNTDLNSRGEYLWSHGLISDSIYEMLQTKCNYSQIWRQTHYNKLSLSPACSMVNTEMTNEIGKFINYYDVTLDVCLPSISQQAQFLKLKNEQEINVCQGDETNKYMNRKDVQTSIHAQLLGVTQWTVCSTVVKYQLENLQTSTLPLLGSLTKAGVPVFIFSGDQDAVVPLIGTRALIKRLANDLRLNTTVPYRTWLHNKQVGGSTQVYGDILTFATVRGASHGAPYSQPARSLELFTSFLNGKPLPDAS